MTMPTGKPRVCNLAPLARLFERAAVLDHRIHYEIKRTDDGMVLEARLYRQSSGFSMVARRDGATAVIGKPNRTDVEMLLSAYMKRLETDE